MQEAGSLVISLKFTVGDDLPAYCTHGASSGARLQWVLVDVADGHIGLHVWMCMHA